MRSAVTCALVFALVAPVTARAQARPDDALAPARVDPLLLDRSYRRANWKRNVGIGLAAPGLALAILGSVLVGYASNDSHLFAAGVEYASGAVIGGLGIFLTIPGVVLWITGQDDMDVATWRKKQLLEIRF